MALDREWMADAVCAETDPELWFPTIVQPTWQTAEALCGTCPVQQQCLEYAMADPTLTGIWGGVSERRRREMRGHGPTRGTPRKDQEHAIELHRRGVPLPQIARELNVTQRSVLRWLQRSTS